MRGGEEMAGGKIVGPGGTSSQGKMTGYNTKGPGGVAGSNTSTTTSKGYEGSRTMGTRKEYKSSGMASNSKAGKGTY
jgi:hypothetical protein